MTVEQQDIIRKLGVAPVFDVWREIERRIAFLVEYVRSSGSESLVLGISGGIDSLTAGILAKRTVRVLRDTDYDARFVAVRLPYGSQADEHDAERCLAIIDPDRTVTIDIKPATDALMRSITMEAGEFISGRRHHFHLGNIKARQRMITQYALAGGDKGLVIGTDHAAEALMGFYTKFGDGAADILPLAGLNKRRIRSIARQLGAPDDLVFKTPTADLESDAPLKPDEDVYGVTYNEIDDFLEGKEIDTLSMNKILSAYRASAHKRALPVVPDPVSRT